MVSLWEALMAVLASSSGWAAILAAAVATLCVILLLVIGICIVLAVWGLVMYVRRFLGWRALWRAD